MSLNSRSACGRWVVALFVLLGMGCGKSSPPRFKLDMVYQVDNDIQEQNQQAIADTLVALFGTPDEPRAPAGSGLDVQKLQFAAGRVWSDEEGAKRGLYREHCVHCHGVSGDGRGPTAMFLNPYPRDYRAGYFKFKSTQRTQKPSDEDLRNILVQGIPGTAMPSFKLLPRDELDALVEYVKYLSIRGEVERVLATSVSQELELDEETGYSVRLDPTNNAEHAALVQELVVSVAETWSPESRETVRPEADQLIADDRSAEEIAASVAKGRELFYGTKANCFSCHGATAIGDGQQDDWDEWNKSWHNFTVQTESLQQRLEDMVDQEERDRDEEDRLEDAIAMRESIQETMFPIRNAIPRNLRLGVYRGGRRPIDLFWRVHEGINGTPMPAGGGTLSDEEIWNIVDYVRSLPYEPASRPLEVLPENVRERM